MRSVLLRLALVAGAVAWPSTAAAQHWRLGVDAGRIRSSLDPVERRSVSLAAGGGYEGATAALRLSAGIPGPTDSVRWASIGAWKRLAGTIGAVTGGVDLSGNAFAFRMPGSAAPVGRGPLGPLPPASSSGSTVSGRALAGQVLPVVAYTAGGVQLQARAGVSYHHATAGDVARERVASLGDLQVVVRPAPTAAIIPTLRHVRPNAEQAATFLGASGIVATQGGRVQLRGDLGRWTGAVASDAAAVAWGAGGELRVTPLVSLTAGVRKSGFDPVYLSPDQTAWNVGASVTLGRAPTPRAAPIATRDARGTASIVLPGSHAASAPRVAGDFNGWTPATMERDGGNWRYTVAAAPGVYSYAFVSADGDWFVPEGTPGRKDDGMGGHVAVVVIR